MLLMLLAAGAVPEASGSVTGPFDVPAERIAVAAKVQKATSLGTEIPLGAAEWQQPFDPADHAPFGFSFDDVLQPDETIASIDRIGLSGKAASLGVIIDATPPRAPTIDENGERRVQLWFSVDPALWEVASYDASGVRLPVSFRVVTSKGARFERSAVLTVRQL